MKAVCGGADFAFFFALEYRHERICYPSLLDPGVLTREYCTDTESLCMDDNGTL
jgi:hypothetical protein